MYSEWVDGWMDAWREWMDAWRESGWMEGCMHRGRVNGCTMGGWMHGGRIDGCTVGRWVEAWR
jgi:hypothetical protein